ncbi:hypothetical protein P879_03835 [Paragonimus westermani]|uniref:Bromo domain-containing protein n=1 Tax=Paragonimus westermani TaxID=34504 RepID=A0A8T0DHR0_9TREM|nr:hypothetical protein P879_03835 [Paragonimus westermani]
MRLRERGVRKRELKELSSTNDSFGDDFSVGKGSGKRRTLGDVFSLQSPSLEPGSSFSLQGHIPEVELSKLSSSDISKLETSSPRQDSKRRGRPKRLVHFKPVGVTRDAIELPSSTVLHETAVDRQTDYFGSAVNRPSSSDSDIGQSPSAIGRRLRPRAAAPQFYSTTRALSSRSTDPRGSDERPAGRLRNYRRSARRASLSDLETPNRTAKVHSVEADDESCDVDNEQDKGAAVDGDIRRYPVRNRRHTAVYQVEYPQHNHHHNGSARNWLAGTGYENGGRRRRHRSRSYRGLQRYGSSTSSSIDSDSETSTPERNGLLEPPPTDDPAYRASFRTSWSHRNAPATTIASTERVDEDEERFARRCTKSIMHSRSELMPINMKRTDSKVKSVLTDRLLSGITLADIEPMTIDDSIGFDQVGGHEKHIAALKESIILPLMYPEVFAQFGIDPPRGVLFSGSPGTGKTLLARALANECTRMNSSKSTDTGKGADQLRRPIAFFMRKGADCLSKWVGESERQLRLLFDQAYRMRPSIIFFDEIDGLAPVRSSKQDQIHSSIVSTLLSLMDGLDSRAEVVVIGATNRPDAIDPALRRPGRFDREFTFNLPCESVRRRILEVHTARWNPLPDAELLDQLAHVTGNFSGADLKALTTEACLCCLRRQYPQVYQSRTKLALDKKYLVVDRSDWLQALQLVRPSNDRADADASSGSLTSAASALATTRRSPLSTTLTGLLGDTVSLLVTWFTQRLTNSTLSSTISSDLPDDLVRVSGALVDSNLAIFTGDIPDCVMDATWHRLELLQVFTLSATNLVAFPTSIGMCPEAAIAQILSAVKRATTMPVAQSLSETQAVHGVVVYMPRVDVLFRRLPASVSLYLCDRLEALAQELMLTEDLLFPSPNCESAGSELTRAVSQRSCRLLLVATTKQGSTKRLPPVHDRSIQSSADLNSSPGRPSADTISPGCHQSVQAKPVPERVLHNGIGPGRKSSARTKSMRTSSGAMAAMPTPDQLSYSPTLGSSGLTDTVRFSCSETPFSTSETSGSSDSSLDVDRVKLMTTYKHTPRDSRSSANQLSAAIPHVTHQLCERHRGSRQHRSSRLLSRLFCPSKAVRVHFAPPCHERRAMFFAPVLTMWPQRDPVSNTDWRDGQIEQVTVLSRAPSPPPVLTEPDAPINDSHTPVTLSPEELLEIERAEAQLFRRLRQVLRRVVAHLARHRRFAVFTRPVQVDEAPDYYEVIKRPMDLGSVRDRIDARQYTNAEEFMKDIELIYHNALEYNPANVPRSRDIRSRAAEFWDEACLQLEEELHPPDLNERCKAATEAQAVRAAAAKRSTKLDSRARTANTKSPVAPFSPNHTVSEPSSPPPKLPPMPQGGRYSRRLHGQPPVLEPKDVEVLAAAVHRRRSSSILGAPLSSPDKKQIRTKMGLHSFDVDIDANHENSLTLPNEQPSVPPDSKSLENSNIDKLVNGSPHTSMSCYNRTVSPRSPSTPRSSISTPVFSPGDSGTPVPSATAAVSEQRSADTVIAGELNAQQLSRFHGTVVDGTQGWSVEQLFRLQREFACAVLRREPVRTESECMELIKQLQRIFQSHVKHNASSGC